MKKIKEYIAVFIIVGYTINMFLATIIHENWILYCLWFWVFIFLGIAVLWILEDE